MKDSNPCNIFGWGHGGRAFGYFTTSGANPVLSGVAFGSGLYTRPLKTLQYRDKTFFWLSADSSGTYRIEVNTPDDVWYTYDSGVFTSGVLSSYIMTAQALNTRLRNEPTMSGTVTAWYIMRT